MTRNEGSNPSSPEFQIPVWMLERFRKMTECVGINLYAFVCIKEINFRLSGGYLFKCPCPHIYFGWQDLGHTFIYSDEDRIGVFLLESEFDIHFKILGKIS